MSSPNSSFGGMQIGFCCWVEGAVDCLEYYAGACEEAPEVPVEPDDPFKAAPCVEAPCVEAPCIEAPCVEAPAVPCVEAP